MNKFYESVRILQSKAIPGGNNKSIGLLNKPSISKVSVNWQKDILKFEVLECGNIYKFKFYLNNILDEERLYKILKALDLIEEGE